MLSKTSKTCIRFVAWLAGFALLTAILVLVSRNVLPAQALPKNIGSDFIQFWAAAHFVASGENPYDRNNQIRLQKEYGWDKETDGLGQYDFTPYYYPPWVALGCTPFLWLDYATAKIAWLIVNCELLFVSGWLLRHSVPHLSRWVPVVLVPIFFFSLHALVIGQIDPLVLFLVVASWRLLEGGWDFPAGLLLGCLTIKPQLTIVLILALLAWSIRQHRWRIVGGFAAGFGLLLVASTFVLPGWSVVHLALPVRSTIVNINIIVPEWSFHMGKAPAETPLITADSPWKGASWLCLARTAGLNGWLLWTAYVMVAAPLGLLVVRSAVERTQTVHEPTSLSLLAAFFIIPYARAYDFLLLLVPLLFLLRGRISVAWASIVVASLVFLPYAQFLFVHPAALWLTKLQYFGSPFCSSWRGQQRLFLRCQQTVTSVTEGDT